MSPPAGVHPSQFHPTKQALIEAAVALMETTTPEQISLEAVQSVTGISTGSVYHHFEDFTDLIEHAIIARYTSYVNEAVVLLDSIKDSANSAEQFVAILLSISRRTQESSTRARRMERASAAVRTAESARFATALGLEQQRLTDAFTHLVEFAQERNWVRRSVSARSIAVFIQAYTLGRILDDITPNPVDDEHWIDLIDLVITNVIAGE